MKRGILYTFVYILITAVSAFATVMLSALIPSTGSFASGDQLENAIVEPTAGEKVLNNFMTMGTSEINLELELINTNVNSKVLTAKETVDLNAIQITFNGNINISDLQNVQANGNLTLIMQGNTISLDIAFINNTLYVSNETLNIKLEASNLSKIMDILPTLGIDMNLDIDMSSFDINKITENFSNMKEKELENGNKALTLELMEGVAVDFITDSNYNVKGITADRVQIANYVINAEAGLEQVDIEIENPEEKAEVEFVDVTKTLNIMDSVKEMMSNEKLHLNINTSVEDMDVSISGDIDVDFSNRINAFANLNVDIQNKTHNLQVGFINEDLYLTLNNFDFIVAESTIYDTFRVIGAREGLSAIEQEIIIAVAKSIPGINVAEILQGNFSSVNINNLLEFSTGEDNVINVTVNGEAFNSTNNIEVIIRLDNNDQFKDLTINGLELLGKKVSVDVAYSSEVNIPSLNSADYYDLKDLPNFVNALLNTYDNINNTKQCDFNINSVVYVKGLPVKVNGNFSVEFNNKEVVYADINAKVFNKTFNIVITYKENNVYLEVDNLKFSCSVNDIENVIEVVKTNLENNQLATALEVAKQAVNVGGALANITSFNLETLPLEIISAVSMENGLLSLNISKEVLNLTNDITINVVYSNQLDSVELILADYNANVKLGLTSDVEIPVVNDIEYTSLTHLDSLTNAILNTANQIVANNGITLNISANIVYNNCNIPVVGDVVINNNAKYITLSATYNSRTINIDLYYINNEIYVNVDGLKVKTTISGLTNIAKLFAESAEAQVLFVATNLSQIDLSMLDLSTINFDVVNNVNIGEDVTSVELCGKNIGLNDNIYVNVNYNNAINNIEVSNIIANNLSVNLTVSLANEYNVPAINQDEFSDISYTYNILSSINNTIKHLKENKQVAVTINSKLANKVVINGAIYVDYSKVVDINADYNKLSALVVLNIMADTTYNVTLRVNNGYLFVEYNGFNLKAQINSIFEVAELVKTMLPADMTVNLPIDNQIATSIMADIVAGDYSKLTLKLIKQISMTDNATNLVLDKALLGADRDISVYIGYNDKINSVNIPYLTVNKNNYSLNTRFEYSVVLPKVHSDRYFDVSGLPNLAKAVLNTISEVSNNKYVALNISNINAVVNNNVFNVNGNMYINFANAFETNESGQSVFNYKNLEGYLNVQLKTKTIDGTFADYVHNIEVYYVDQYIYVTYNTLKVCVSVDSLTSVVDLINQIKQLQYKINGTPTEMLNINQNIDFVEILESVFTNISVAEIMQGNINSKIVKYLNIGNDLTITLDKNILGCANDISLTSTYLDRINNISFEGLSYNNINVYGSIGLEYSFVMPTVNIAQYSNLDNLTEAMSSVLNTAEDVVDNNNIAFSLNTELVHTSYDKDAGGEIQKEIVTAVKLMDGSYAKFDWSNAYEQTETGNKFNLQNMSIYAKFVAKVDTTTCYYTAGVKDLSTLATVSNTHNIEITYLNNVVYISFDSMKAYISGDTIGGVIDVVCQMLGLEVSTNSFDNLVNLISNSVDGSMLSKVKVEMLQSIAVSNNTVSAVIDIAPLELGLGQFTVLDMDILYKDGLQNLTINNLSLANIDVDAVNIGIMEFTPIENVDVAGYINFAGVESLLDAINNTLQFTDYEIDGNVKLQLNILDINFDIKVNAKAKITDNGLEAKAVLGPIPVITGVNDDAPYIAGNTVEGINPGKERILTIYIKDNYVYLYRTERVPAFLTQDRIYEKRTKVHMDTFVDDPLYFVLEYGMGFNQTIMPLIYDAIYKERINPLDYSNILTNYYKDGDKYSLSINMEELMEDEKIQNLDVDITPIMYNGKNVINVLGIDLFMPVADGVEISLFSDDLTFINRDQIIDFSGDLYPYVNEHLTDKEGAEWDAYNGSWELATQRKFTVEFVTNCDQAISTYEGIAGSRFNLPTLQNYYVDSADYRTYYEFVGWYDTITFDNEYTDAVMPRKSIKLYAKWSTYTEKYITIDFVENGGSELLALKVLEGSLLTLPQYFDLLIVEYADKIETKQFAGWYSDAEFTNAFSNEYAPNNNITLYAKWELVDMLQTYAVNLYDNGEKIATRRFFEGSAISFNGLAKINDTTKYYYDANLTTEVVDMSMPSYDIDIYIANEYTVTIISDYGTRINMVYKAYQGTPITIIPTQQGYSYDEDVDGDGKAENVKHTFNGYKVNGVLGSIDVVPNGNVQIVADWTVEHLEYYMVKFHVDWVKPGSWQDNNSKLLGKIDKIKGATAPASFEVLEGTTIDPSKYNATCRYKYTGAYVGKEYNFDVATWSTSGGGQLYYNNGVFKNDDYTKLTSLTITDNTDLYAVWKNV